MPESQPRLFEENGTASRSTCVGHKPGMVNPLFGQRADAKLAPPYTAEEAAGFVRQGACMVAWPPEEVWRDPVLGEGVGEVEDGGMAAGAPGKE